MQKLSLATEPPWVVDCADAPFDLRPAVHAIMQAENWLLDRMPEGQPLVILMGEFHIFQTHQLLQQAVLKAQLAHRADRPFAFGVETHKAYENAARAGSYAVAAVQGFCKTHKIDVGFNDAARVCLDLGMFKGTALASDDSDNIAHGERHGFDFEAMDMDFGSPDSLAFRNSFMAEKALTHMRETGARIYVQNCGMRHLFGGESPGRTTHYKNSLTAEFLRRGAEVLPVLISAKHGGVIDTGRMIKTLDIPGAVRRHTVTVCGLDNGEDFMPYGLVRDDVNRASYLSLA